MTSERKQGGSTDQPAGYVGQDTAGIAITLINTFPSAEAPAAPGEGDRTVTVQTLTSIATGHEVKVVDMFGVVPNSDTTSVRGPGDMGPADWN